MSSEASLSGSRCICPGQTLSQYLSPQLTIGQSVSQLVTRLRNHRKFSSIFKKKNGFLKILQKIFLCLSKISLVWDLMEENDDKYLHMILESKQDHSGEIMGICVSTVRVLPCPRVFGLSLWSHSVFVTGRKDTHLWPGAKSTSGGKSRKPSVTWPVVLWVSDFTARFSPLPSWNLLTLDILW